MTIAHIQLPKFAKVLILEDSAMRQEWFRRRIPDVTIVNSVAAFKQYIQEHPAVDILFLDHDLGEGGDGYEAAVYLRDTFATNGRNITIHSINTAGVDRMRGALPKAICIPFGDFEVEVED